MITSITIGQNFGEYQVSKGHPQPGIDRLIRSHRYYPIPSLPIGHTLDTSSNLVVIIGDNGAGKSTLLRRISQEEVIATYDEGDTYTTSQIFHTLHTLKQPELPGFATDVITAEQTMSQGTYKIYSLDKVLDKYEEEVQQQFNETRILLLDQPEDSISLRNKRRIIERIKTLAFEGRGQIFVATHEERFLGIAGSKIINLDERPARSYDGATFDTRMYLE